MKVSNHAQRYSFVLILVSISTAAAFGQDFTDLDVGIQGLRQASVSWGDYDGDRDLDVVISGRNQIDDTTSINTTLLYRNDAGAFVDVGAGLVGLSHSSTAWGDYDNDGDIDLAINGFESDGAAISKVYRNDSGILVDSNQSLLDLGNGSVSWADYDNDGDLDLLVSGDLECCNSQRLRFYRNDEGAFVEVDVGLPPNARARVDWGDYDHDGDLDLLLNAVNEDAPFEFSILRNLYRNDDGSFNDAEAGFTGGGSLDSFLNRLAHWNDYDGDGDLDVLLYPKLYRNTLGTYTKVDVGLRDSLLSASAEWSDFDNDGDPDLAVTGRDFQSGDAVSILYRNDGGSFTDLGAGIAGSASGTGSQIAWGDYDNDGDVDLLTSVIGSFPDYTTRIYRNEALLPNLPPSSPADPGFVDEGGGAARLVWTGSTDFETASAGLTHNVRLGTTPGGSEVVSSMSGPDGFRKIVEGGNAGTNTSLTISGLQEDTPYYWAVQAVDNGYMSSPFTTERTVILGGDTCTWTGVTASWDSAASWSCGHVPTASDHVAVGSGMPVLDGQAAVLSYTQTGGNLGGTGSLIVSNEFTWTGGQISGSGVITTNSPAALSGVTLEGRTLELAGGGTWTNGDLVLRDAATLVVPAGQIFTMTPPGWRIFNPGTAPADAQLEVAGSLVFASTNSATTGIEVAVAFDGPVDVQQGTLSLRRSSTYTPAADMTLASGSVLEISGGSHGFDGVQLSGAGLFRHTGGASTTMSNGASIAGPVLLQSGTLTAGEATTFTGYTQTGGTLTGPADITVSDSFSWTGGVISGTGLLTSEPAVTLSSVQLIDRTLELAGGGTWTNGDLVLRDAATLVVPAGQIFTMTPPGWRIFNSGTAPADAQLEVAGSLVFASSNSATTGIEVAVAFDGPVDVQQGTLSLRRSSTYTPAADMTLASGSVLEISGGSHGFDGVQLSGAGLFRHTGGASTTMSNGASIAGPVLLQSGTLTAGEATTFTGYTQTGGTLTGPADITVSDSFSWTGGVISGTGLLTSEPAVTLSSVQLIDRTLELAGGGTWTNGDLVLRDAATLVVPAGQIFTMTPPGWRMFNSGTAPADAQLEVAGSLVFASTNSATTGIEVAVDNQGTIRSTAGTLAFRRAVNNDGRFEGTAGLDFQNATFTNGGAFAPGVSPGLLSYTGKYVNSTLEIELAGIEVGTEYDQLKISGQAELGGTLEVTTVNSFAPGMGNEFQILTASDVTGTFDDVILPDTGPDRDIIVVYGAADVRLFVAGPNALPTAIADETSTLEDNPVQIDVLDNDSDDDGDSLTIDRLLADPEHGTAEIIDQKVLYTPAENYYGTDDFVYVLRDERGGQDSASVHITITAVNDPPDAAVLQSPEDGATILIEGEADTPFVVAWSAATDVEDDVVTYVWQLSASPDFSATIFETDTGSATQIQTTFGEIASLLADNGVSVGESATLFHRVVSSDGTDETTGVSLSVTLTRGITVAVDGDLEIPERFALYQNYPNPFNPTTSIRFDLPVQETVLIGVYNIVGEQVAHLMDQDLSAGSYEVSLDARDLSSGLYIYRMAAGSFIEARAMVVLK